MSAVAVVPLGAAGALAMSSREIAELVEKRHDNVKRTIETLAARGLVHPQFEDEQDPDALGRSRVTQVYRIGKRDSYVIVAQLSPEFTARLVDRWQELEARASAPALPNFADPVAAARAWADAKEAEQKALVLLEEQRPAVEFVDRYVDSAGTMGFREVCKVLRANERLAERGVITLPPMVEDLDSLKVAIELLAKRGVIALPPLAEVLNAGPQAHDD